jgi:glutamine amidotransferase PdxT
MALFFTFSTVIIKVNLFGNDLISSWSIAIMLLFGFITHLVLDEICSVNLMNIRVKKSFGSAVKFFDKSNTSGYLILYLLLSLLFIRTPTITPFLKVVYAKLNKLVFLTPLGKNLLVYLLNQLDN